MAGGRARAGGGGLPHRAGPAMSAPLVYVGLDAVDRDLVEPWARAGRMPTLARLLACGARATTEGPPGVYVGAIWPSLVTGTNPARHGYHCWLQVRPGTYDIDRH